MQDIRVSQEVWDAIAKRGKFGETEDDVLRRVLGVAPAGAQERGRLAGGRKGRGNIRYATKRMSSRKEGDHLVVEFSDGKAGRWKLPDHKDKEGIKRLRETAAAFVVSNGGTDPGQTNAVRKTLTDAGYFLHK
jgi:hypothetical protein